MPTLDEKKRQLDSLDRQCCGAHAVWYALEQMKMDKAREWNMLDYVTDYRKVDNSCQQQSN